MTSVTRLAAVPAVLLTVGLAACVPGPRANSAVVELGQGALAAAHTGELPAGEELAETFFAEAERLCGTPLPPTCEVDREPAATPLTWPGLADAVDDVPSASADLVVKEAVAAKAGPGEVALPSPEELAHIDRSRLSRADLEALAGLLSWEQSLRFGLTAAAAWTEDTSWLVASSDARAALLEELLAGSGLAPAAATGYEFDVDPSELVDRAGEETQKAWSRAAAGISDDALREVVLTGAAHAKTASPTK